MTAQVSIRQLREFIGSYIVGQEVLVNRLLIALLADGHLLVEGAPGLAKTRAIKSLCLGIDANFHRIQFTPDLLPADLTGTEVYRPHDGSFSFQKGPLFHNLILADEINRAPAKVQSALLEAMAERQITVGSRTYRLPQLFLVMATQNPIEQEGTYPLPEAQLDRFLMHVHMNYPNVKQEGGILRMARAEARSNVRDGIERPKPTGNPHAAPDTANPTRQRAAAAQAAGNDLGGHGRLDQQVILQARREVLEVYMTENLERYVVQLVIATRDASPYDPQLAQWIQYGCSPRATIMLDRCARAHAWLNGADFVTPDDIQAVAPDVMRHRLILGFEAEADEVTPDRVIRELLARVPVP